eukprot:scaffold31340_cov53-Attheya_sp.AAC.4
MTNGRGLLIAVVLLLVALLCSADMKAKWTPADKEEGFGPLPQSMKKRVQLLHLEQVIANSPNPTATLKKVSVSMNMKPRELDRMLKRNAADMIMASTTAGVDKASATTGTNRRCGTFRRKMRGMRKKLAILLVASLAPLLVAS